MRQVVVAFLFLATFRLAGATSAPVVAHAPAQPKAGEVVTITASLPGASNVTLHVQTVVPGSYLRRTDAAFSNTWREFPMTPGKGDASRFTASLPGKMQQHRTLVRYFVSAQSNDGVRRRFPSETNKCPNFAYFVYNGIPAWTGASVPGKTPPINFSAEFMKTMPAYHLIARREDVEQSQWDGAANRKRFHGTFIYEGRVYDHIQYHNRGKASTYVSGKNKWGFKFNADERFEDRDLWGRPVQRQKSLSLTSCASPWAQVNRGMSGMDEAVSFRAYQLAGVPAADTHWLQLRVIAGVEEAPKDQYRGDVWGLYQVIEEPGGEWLRSHGWADGDIYSPESGAKYKAKGSPDNDSTFQYLMAGPRGSLPEVWWRTNLNLPNYYTFHALNRVVSNVDVRPGANYYAYREPDGRWSIVPWDLDMMFIPRTHQPGVVDQARCLDVPALKREYQARAREVLDLFCSDAGVSGGQIGQLVTELAQFIAPAGAERTWAELDMCVWNQHPRNTARGQFYANPARDNRFGGDWTRTLATPDFAGFCKYIVDFCTDSRPTKNYAINDGGQRGYGFGYLSVESKDSHIPKRPVVKQGKDQFEVSQFVASDRATNSSFAAMQWRVGRISAPGLAGFKAGEPWKYEIEEFWRSPEIAMAKPLKVADTPCMPGQTYRARARFKDTTGRWSHWSEPVQFVGQPADSRSR